MAIVHGSLSVVPDMIDIFRSVVNFPKYLKCDETRPDCRVLSAVATTRWLMYERVSRGTLARIILATRAIASH
jgi:hypothetical protein